VRQDDVAPVHALLHERRAAADEAADVALEVVTVFLRLNETGVVRAARDAGQVVPRADAAAEDAAVVWNSIILVESENS
jgi:hypothetical protein